MFPNDLAGIYFCGWWELIGIPGVGNVAIAKHQPQNKTNSKIINRDGR